MFKETDLGFFYQAKDHLVFFGKKICGIENLKHTYPNFDFRQTHQTHSDILIQSSVGSENIEADAHFTLEKNVALVIRSADCIPAFVFDKDGGVAIAIHAGWRGVEKKILPKSLKHLNINKNFNLYLGPHILQRSFQIDLEVKNRLQPESHQFFQNGEKFYVDLKSVLTDQIKLFTEFRTHSLEMDTLTDLQFNSFRRDKENSGRNLSFIVKNL